jgi:hypothetical protein
MNTLRINFNQTSFELLISWFDSMGYPCRERGLHTAQGKHWYIGILYDHFSVNIYDDKLYTLAGLRWS